MARRGLRWAAAAGALALLLAGHAHAAAAPKPGAGQARADAKTVSVDQCEWQKSEDRCRLSTGAPSVPSGSGPGRAWDRPATGALARTRSQCLSMHAPRRPGAPHSRPPRPPSPPSPPPPVMIPALLDAKPASAEAAAMVAAFAAGELCGLRQGKADCLAAPAEDHCMWNTDSAKVRSRQATPRRRAAARTPRAEPARRSPGRHPAAARSDNTPSPAPLPPPPPSRRA
jgi:hypothetical protein